MLKNSKWLSQESRDPLKLVACAGSTLSTPEKSQYLSEKKSVD